MLHLVHSRINDGKWRGTTESCLLHWNHQMAQHNKVSGHKFIDSQMKILLSSAVRDIPEFRAIKTTAQQVHSSGSSDTPQSCTEHFNLLIGAAQEHDKTNAKTPRRSKRQVYNAVVNDDDISSGDDADVFCDADGCEVHQHNFDTPLCVLNQQLQHPSSSKMPLAVWQTLDDDDKNIWDRLSDATKAAILNARQPSNRPSSRPPPGAPSGRPRPSSRPPPRQVHHTDTDLAAFASAFQHFAEGRVATAVDANVTETAEAAETTPDDTDPFSEQDQQLLAYLTERKKAASAHAANAPNKKSSPLASTSKPSKK